MADKYAMEDEHSRFFMHDGSSANPANFKDDVGSQYEANIAPDIQPIEAPVENMGENRCQKIELSHLHLMKKQFWLLA